MHSPSAFVACFSSTGASPLAHPSESSSRKTAVRTRGAVQVQDQVARVAYPSESRGVCDDQAARSTKRLEMVVALTASWDAMFRLPSDLIPMRTDSVVEFKRSTPHRWALLLYPAEFEERSKINGCDEGVVLKHTMWQGRCFPTVSPRLAELQRARLLRSLPGPVEGARGMKCHYLPVTRCCISRNRSGRHGLRTSSPTPSCVRPQHSTFFTKRTMLGRAS